MRYGKTLGLGGSALLIGSALAFAQGPLFDPQQLPVYKGQVQLFTLTPRGDIDGMILTDGTEVKTPPHLSTQLAFAVKLGDAVTIHGLKAASLPLVEAMSITDDASGKVIIDNGPPGPGREGRDGPGRDGGRGPGPGEDAGPPPPPPAAAGLQPPPPPAGGAAPPPPVLADEDGMTQVQGRVRMPLHGPRGDVNGALLEDGTILRLPPPEAQRFASLLQPGQTVVAEGFTFDNLIGKVLGVGMIGPSKDQLSPVGPPRGGKRGWHRPPPM